MFVDRLDPHTGPRIQETQLSRFTHESITLLLVRAYTFPFVNVQQARSLHCPLQQELDSPS